MKLLRYEYLTESEAELFKFISIGAKGNIKKLVVYSRMIQDNVYNLAFGDYDEETEAIDDAIITNNNDSQKVLATVASTLYVLPTSIQMFGFMQKAAIMPGQDFIEWGLLNTLKKL